MSYKKQVLQKTDSETSTEHLFCSFQSGSHYLTVDHVDLQYNALSFIFLQVRELSWLQWHPFSVSSSPLDGKYHMSILIKVLGKWTEKLRGSISNGPKEDCPMEPLQPHANITVSVEGPYGHESPYHLTYVFFCLNCINVHLKC